MKQTRPPADGLIYPEEVRSTQNLTALVAPFIVDREHQDQVDEPHDEKAGVRAGVVANGHRPYVVKYGRWGEIIIKARDESWVRVIPRKAAAVENRRNNDDGWTMREKDRPTFPRFGTKPLLWRPLGPRQRFFVEYAKLTALKRAAENTAPTTGATGASEIQNLILDLERKEDERKKAARRTSRQKRPPKAERGGKKPRKQETKKKSDREDDGREGKKSRKRGR